MTEPRRDEGKAALTRIGYILSDAPYRGEERDGAWQAFLENQKIILAALDHGRSETVEQAIASFNAQIDKGLDHYAGKIAKRALRNVLPDLIAVRADAQAVVDRLKGASDDDPLWDSSKAGPHGCTCCRNESCSPGCRCHERFVRAKDTTDRRDTK